MTSSLIALLEAIREAGYEVSFTLHADCSITAKVRGAAVTVGPSSIEEGLTKALVEALLS
jgi:hypothetical protein